MFDIFDYLSLFIPQNYFFLLENLLNFVIKKKKKKTIKSLVYLDFPQDFK